LAGASSSRTARPVQEWLRFSRRGTPFSSRNPSYSEATLLFSLHDADEQTTAAVETGAPRRVGGPRRGLGRRAAVADARTGQDRRGTDLLSRSRLPFRPPHATEAALSGPAVGPLRRGREDGNVKRPVPGRTPRPRGEMATVLQVSVTSHGPSSPWQPFHLRRCGPCHADSAGQPARGGGSARARLFSKDPAGFRWPPTTSPSVAAGVRSFAGDSLQTRHGGPSPPLRQP